jgi:ABC-type glycerol-3-phosphate transport system substrate-binding protein
MEINGDWELASAQAAIGTAKTRQTLGVAAMPSPPGGKPYLSHSGWAYMIPAGAKHAAAAMKYVTWMEQPANFAKYLGSVIGIEPARAATLQQSYLTNDPGWQQIIAIENEAGRDWWLAPSPILSQYYTAFDEAQAAVTTLKKSPAAALAAAQKTAQGALQSAQSRGVYGH